MGEPDGSSDGSVTGDVFRSLGANARTNALSGISTDGGASMPCTELRSSGVIKVFIPGVKAGNAIKIL